MRFAVVLALLCLPACAFDTSSIAPGTPNSPAPSPPDASPPPDPSPPDAGSCDDCDDGVACTTDQCSDGICVPTDACSRGTCNPATGQCDVEALFRTGLDGYVGTLDTFLQEQDPNLSPRNRSDFAWDTDFPVNTRRQRAGLLRFLFLFEDEGGPIPGNATIDNASLTLSLLNGAGRPEASRLHLSAVPWPHDVKWQNFGGDFGLQADEIGELVATLPLLACPCPRTINLDVTASLRLWHTGALSNNGWIVVPGSPDGSQAASSEHPDEQLRPQLRVRYSVPPGD